MLNAGSGSVRLMKYDAARTALAEAHRVDEAKDIRDKALALAAYARQAQDRDMVVWVTEIKLRAERRTGELLRETAANGQRRTASNGRPAKAGSADPAFPTLNMLKISEDQSKDWQKLAAIPEPEFEKRLANAARDPKTMTTAKILKPVVAPKPTPFEDEVRVWSGVSGWLSRARELPEVEALKSVRPTGGLRTALRGHFDTAETYMAMLKRLRREDWI